MAIPQTMHITQQSRISHVFTPAIMRVEIAIVRKMNRIQSAVVVAVRYWREGMCARKIKVAAAVKWSAISLTR